MVKLGYEVEYVTTDMDKQNIWGILTAYEPGPNCMQLC